MKNSTIKYQDTEATVIEVLMERETDEDNATFKKYFLHFYRERTDQF